ncbi:MAG: DUF4232 domain-containing protein [Solirubrobacteraceae bacterium]
MRGAEKHLMHIPGSRGLPRCAILVLALGALSGCGNSATTSAPAASGTATVGTTSSASSSAASTTSSSQTTTAGARGQCPATDLLLSYLGGQGATGHGELGFALRNKSARACHISGYPGIQFVDRAGKPLPTSSTDTTEDFFGRSPLRRLSVAPGKTASFRLDVTHGSGSSAPCPTAAGLQVVPPRDTHTLRTLISNGAYECGRANVSPFQPGTTAYRRAGG